MERGQQGDRMDLNSDLGESFGAWAMGDDAAMLGLVTSANIACGFHGGDPVVMERTVGEAARRGVAIGAHVSYPDLVGFGRRRMELSPDQIRTDAMYQIGALEAFASAAGSEVRYVKPHGALYEAASDRTDVTDALLAAARSVRAEMVVVLRAGSEGLAHGRRAGAAVVGEAFADRLYRPDLTLVPRSEPGAVIADPDRAIAQAISIATAKTLLSAPGSEVGIDAQSICVHGDTAAAVAIAAGIRSALEQRGIELSAFAGT